MYCQNCGSQVNDELNFCNRCGNRVSGNELITRDSDATVSVLKLLTASTGVIGVVGLGGLIVMIVKLIENGFQTPGPVFLLLFFAATVFGICFLLTRQISRLSQTPRSEKRSSKQKSAPEQLNSYAAPQIEAPSAPFRSVTENTTRTLEEIPIKIK